VVELAAEVGIAGIEGVVVTGSSVEAVDDIVAGQLEAVRIAVAVEVVERSLAVVEVVPTVDNEILVADPLVLLD
jgi:ABC-type proline/glycine betaine transport system permease subunit